MSHVFFFSYAHENLDKHLREFFEGLCEDVSPNTPWAAKDPRLSFRDKDNLPLMDQWKPSILDALQSSSVFVCITSTAYLQKPFCGQEYWIFDQRRRQSLPTPKVILPVIWAPVQRRLPAFMNEIQWQQGEMPDIYFEKGLRYLKKLAPNEYEVCVAKFADAISRAYQNYPSIPPLSGVAPFENIPNAFAGGQWEEAAGPTGWVSGPGVANFVFAAALKHELPQPPGKYGSSAAEWRPYLPAAAKTISEIAKAAAKKHSLRYREILVNDQLSAELQGARIRKNLTLLLADARTLPFQQYRQVVTFDGETWEGSALLMPWDNVAGLWEDAPLQSAVKTTFPIKSQLKAPVFQAPISTENELERVLDVTLTDLLAAFTKVETEKKYKTDQGPASITGPTGVAA
jgi:FxsC-like protein